MLIYKSDFRISIFFIDGNKKVDFKSITALHKLHNKGRQSFIFKCSYFINKINCEPLCLCKFKKFETKFIFHLLNK